MKSGLLGRKLSHSYSPAIHASFGDYPYPLFEREPEDVENFVRFGDWDGVNVTIPYKKTVLPFLDSVSETVRAVGSANTLVRKNGKIEGHNTDVFGFLYLLRNSGIRYENARTIVLGSGGASVAITHALRTAGIEPVIISRTGEYNYGNLDRVSDAELIVNTTPVGMYPENGEAPLSLTRFPKLRGVIDIIYNPARTALLLEAEKLGIANRSGLSMLVAQAARSSELFTGISVEDRIEEVTRALDASMENVVLIGMPGCGKSSAAKLLGKETGREVIDFDAEIVKRIGKPIPDFFRESGEAAFRNVETAVARDFGKLSGKILSTGGGIVTRPENYELLHQNGQIVFLSRELSLLPKKGRPISMSSDLQELYQKRKPMYEAFRDVTVDNSGTLDDCVKRIKEALHLTGGME